MPLTFPSHAAAVLPFCWARRRWPRLGSWLDPVALVVGSTAPDLPYLLGWHGKPAHLPLGLATWCLPMGMVVYLWWEALVRPAFGLGPARQAGWGAVALSLVLGAATHQLWDGFTHNWLWPATALYPNVMVKIFGIEMYLSKAFQIASSGLGLAATLAYTWRARSALLPGSWPGAPRLAALLAPAVAAGALAGALAARSAAGSWSKQLWDIGWAAVLWGMAGLALTCGLARWRRSGVRLI